jgi:hypothetical protein
MTERTHDDPRMPTKRQELRRFGALFAGAAVVVLVSLPIPFAPGSPWVFVPGTALLVAWMALLRIAIAAVVPRGPDSRVPGSGRGWEIGFGVGIFFGICENMCDALFIGAQCPLICPNGLFW